MGSKCRLLTSLVDGSFALDGRTTVKELHTIHEYDKSKDALTGDN